MKKISLLERPGRPLLSSDVQKHIVLSCSGPGASVEFRFGDARTEDNLSFIPIRTADRETQFGMIRENGGWRLLSIGLLLFDIPQLAQQWSDEDLQAREEAALKTLQALADTVEQYRRTFGVLPDSLTQLGPPDDGAVSPDAAGLIAGDLAKGSRQGYSYRYKLHPAADNDAAQFELTATPQEYGKTGRRSFIRDANGKLRGGDHHGEAARSSDPIVTISHSE